MITCMCTVWLRATETQPQEFYSFTLWANTAWDGVLACEHCVPFDSPRYLGYEVGWNTKPHHPTCDTVLPNRRIMIAQYPTIGE